MTDKPPVGMTDPVQPHEHPTLIPEVPGAGTSGYEEIAKRPCEELMPTEHPDNGGPMAEGEHLVEYKGIVDEFFGAGKDQRVK